MSGLHATLAPSSAGRWVRCAGSVALERRYPDDEDGEAARLGTAAHHYLTETLAGRVVALGAGAPNGVPVDAEMIDAARGMILDVESTARPLGLPLRIEERVDMMTSIHAQCWGTPDVYVIDFANRIVWIWDYKYGHRYVDAYMCWQLIAYACGILESNGVTTWVGWRINVTIAQPRNYAPEGPLRTWSFGGSALVEFAAKLSRAAYEAFAPDAALVTGDHCRDCNAIIPCPANQRVGATCIDISYKHGHADMPPAAIGLEVRLLDTAIKRLKARKDGLDAVAMGIIKNGGRVPGVEYSSEPGADGWALPVEQVISAVRLIEGRDISVPKALTPTQARKAGIDHAVIAQYSKPTSSAMKLRITNDADAIRVLGDRSHTGD